MTQHEFETRTNVALTADLFWEVNEEYNESEKDIDAFCKWWIKHRQLAYTKRMVNQHHELQEKVTIVEQSPDVIKLVASAYTNDPRVEIVNANIFEYKPKERYDCAWFDIWDDISGNEYPEMKTLHRKFGHYVGWSDSWLRKQSRKLYYE